MGLPIRKVLVPESKYSIKCPYSLSPKEIAVHNTANKAPAINEVNYMIGNNLNTSFHYAVDDKEIIQAIPLNRNAWHAGDGTNGKGNRNAIAIEICYSLNDSDIEKFKNAEKLAVKLIAQLLKDYGWGIDKVKRHYDYSGKNCPHRTMALGWDRFLKMIKDELNPPIVYPFKEGTKVYPTVDVQMVSNAGYENPVSWLLKKGTECTVVKYHNIHGLYMALAGADGNYLPSAWTKEFGKFTMTAPVIEVPKPDPTPEPIPEPTPEPVPVPEPEPVEPEPIPQPVPEVPDEPVEPEVSERDYEGDAFVIFLRQIVRWIQDWIASLKK